MASSVCSQKSILFTHLPVKCLREKDAYCSLTHFICCQRCLLDLVSHTKSAILFFTLTQLCLAIFENFIRVSFRKCHKVGQNRPYRIFEGQQQ